MFSPSCREWLGAATDDIDALEIAVAEGRGLLWVRERCAAVTCVLEPLGVAELHVMVAGGELDALQDLEIEVAAYASRLGCARIMNRGRKGWARALPGYALLHYSVKELP